MSSRTTTLEKKTNASAQDCPVTDNACEGMEMPKPGPEHAWLQRFIGTWDADLEMIVPGQPPMPSKGEETWRALGGFWVISQGQNLQFPYQFTMTLGYDPTGKKYVGTWVDTMTSNLTRYEGTVDSTGRVITLETEMPFPPGSNKLTRFRDVMEFKSDDHRVYASAMLMDNGQWHTHLKIQMRRRK